MPVHKIDTCGILLIRSLVRVTTQIAPSPSAAAVDDDEARFSIMPSKALCSSQDTCWVLLIRSLVRVTTTSQIAPAPSAAAVDDDDEPRFSINPSEHHFNR